MYGIISHLLLTKLFNSRAFFSLLLLQLSKKEKKIMQKEKPLKRLSLNNSPTIEIVAFILSNLTSSPSK